MDFYADGIEGLVQTTDATPTEMARKAINENMSGIVTVNVGAVSTGGVHASWSLSANIKRDSGDVSITGSIANLVTPGKELGSLLWDASLSADGADLVVTVTGASGVTIAWAGLGPIQGVQDN